MAVTAPAQPLASPAPRPRSARLRATASRWIEAYLSRGFDARVVVGPRR